MALRDLFHDVPDDDLTRRWNAARARLDDIFDKALQVKWYDFLGLPGLLLDAPHRREVVMPFYDRGNAIDDAWYTAVDAQSFGGRWDAATALEQLADDAQAALLNPDGSPRESLGQRAENAAKSVLFGLEVGTVVVVAVLALVAYYGVRK